MDSLQDHICICSKCQLDSSNSVFTAKGKKTEFVLKNNNKTVVDKFIVDDCLLVGYNRDEKCDYLFRLKNEKIAYLIECKGSDILKAVSQLNSTLDILKTGLIDYLVMAKIISTKVYSPDIRDRKYLNLKRKLNGNLETKNILLEINI